MCGRYYVDEDMVKEVLTLVRQLDQSRRKEVPGDALICSAKDIHPTELAPILTVSDQSLCCRHQRWGFPGFEKRQVIFNARSESAPEKRMFRAGIVHRRIVIPAAGFYEWNQNKEKNIFRSKESPVLYMAGIYNQYDNEERFVILTTKANASMKPVHDRMPLILEPDEIVPWILDENRTEAILRKTPGLLERRTEYEQLSLF